MRLHWKGFDGGAEARADIEQFFERVAARARPLPAGAGASGAENPGGAP